MNTAAQAALANIRNTIARQEKVVFVFHCWHDFPNLAMGFKFPEVPLETIPRLTLIPLVETENKHIESRVDDRSPSLSIKPVFIPYRRNINDAYLDLQNKYGKYGFTRVPALDCTLDDVDRLDGIFNRMMANFTGLLQDLPEYFGAISPVKDLFGPDKQRVQTNAKAELKRLWNEGEIDESDNLKFQEAIKTFAQSSIAAHRQALDPISGLLTTSIREINEGTKTSFDYTDEFLVRQFPAFDSTSRVSKARETDGIDRLVDLLADRLSAPRAAVKEQVEEAVAPATPYQEVDTVENGTEAQLLCKAETASGEPCKRVATANGYCTSPPHQAQAEESYTGEPFAEPAKGDTEAPANIDLVEFFSTELTKE